MLSKTHKLIGLATLVTAGVYLKPQGLSVINITLISIANIIGSLLPDIDSSSNRLWDMLPGGNYLGRIFKSLFHGHRNLTHSILGMVMVYKISFWLIDQIFNPNYINTYYVTISLLLGYAAHLFADSLTENGLPLFWPGRLAIGLPPFRFLRIKTGGFVETYIVFPAVLIYLIYLGASTWLNLPICLNLFQDNQFSQIFLKCIKKDVL